LSFQSVAKFVIQSLVTTTNFSSSSFVVTTDWIALSVVRKYGFKLEGGEWFKDVFRKLLSLEWNCFENILIKKLVFQNTKQKAQNQKNNRLFRRNNRLFIPATHIKIEFKELRDREKNTQRFILVHSKPRATSSLLRNHWGIPLSNQT